MRSARAEALWDEFRRHEGLNHAHYEATRFRTPPEVAERLLDLMLAGVMRATVGPTRIFGEGRYEPLPEAGDYAVLMDTGNRPQLIWRTTGTTIAPLSSVTDEFVWRSGEGTGERDDWLRRISWNFTRNAKHYGYEMHDDIETMFETLEVIWPEEIARRVRLVTSHLDRSIALLGRLNEQRGRADSLETILSRIQTAVITVGSAMALAFTNPAAELLLQRGDGLRVRNGRLAARCETDHRRLTDAVADACEQPAIDGLSQVPTGPIAAGKLISIHRDQDQPPYRVSLFPLRRGHAVRGLTPTAEAVMFVDDPNNDARPAQTDLYAHAFRLTPAEARLAVHLASGASLTEAAEAFGVTHNTARAQLRSIFDKTDTHRQGDLVRLLHTTRSLRIALT
jgi:uncharacterized protein YhfF/DNA-binding CsgD family transcriptional regulator